MNRAVALLRTDRLALASAEFEVLWKDENSPWRGEAAYHNGIALDRLGRDADAELWLQRAASVDQRLDGALLYIGMLRERGGDLQGAGRAYRDYLKAHPDSPVALLRFGISAQKSGRPEVARTYFERLLKAAPQSAEAIEARKILVMWE